MKVKSLFVSSIALLTIVFVFLKLTGNIDWAWHWVLAPIWLTVAFALDAVLLFLLLALLKD